MPFFSREEQNKKGESVFIYDYADDEGANDLVAAIIANADEKPVLKGELDGKHGNVAPKNVETHLSRGGRVIVVSLCGGVKVKTLVGEDSASVIPEDGNRATGDMALDAEEAPLVEDPDDGYADDDAYDTEMPPELEVFDAPRDKPQRKRPQRDDDDDAAEPDDDGESVPDRLGVGGWIPWLLLAAVPLVNIFVALIPIINPSKGPGRNWATAQLIISVITTLLAIVIAVLLALGMGSGSGNTGSNSNSSGSPTSTLSMDSGDDGEEEEDSDDTPKVPTGSFSPGSSEDSSPDDAPIGALDGLTAVNGNLENGSGSSEEGDILAMGDKDASDEGGDDDPPTLDETVSSIEVATGDNAQISPRGDGTKLLVVRYTITNGGDSPVNSASQIQFDATLNGKTLSEGTPEDYSDLDTAQAGTTIPPDKTISFDKAWIFDESGPIVIQVKDATTGATLGSGDKFRVTM